MRWPTPQHGQRRKMQVHVFAIHAVNHNLIPYTTVLPTEGTPQCCRLRGLQALCGTEEWAGSAIAGKFTETYDLKVVQPRALPWARPGCRHCHANNGDTSLTSNNGTHGCTTIPMTPREKRAEDRAHLARLVGKAASMACDAAAPVVSLSASAVS